MSILTLSHEPCSWKRNRCHFWSLTSGCVHLVCDCWFSFLNQEREERRQRLKRERPDDRPTHVSQPPIQEQLYQKNHRTYDKSKLPPGKFWLLSVALFRGLWFHVKIVEFFSASSRILIQGIKLLQLVNVNCSNHNGFEVWWLFDSCMCNDLLYWCLIWKSFKM